jgi:outer membrane protein TolC
MMMHLRRCLPIAALLALLPGPALAQNPLQPSSPFLGSAPPPGEATASPVPLSLADTVRRGLEYNLGLLLQEASVTQANGARWRALEDLLPNVSGSVNERRQVLNLAVFGLPVEPAIVGPFNVFDARVALSQPVVDLRALHDYKASALNARAEQRGIKSARDLVVLVSVSLYLQAVSAASRIEVAQAQLDTAQALYTQANDLKNSGLVAGVDVLRAQVQVENQRGRLIDARNAFDKAKLQLARAIGLPPGQDVALTDAIPYAPLENVSVEDALARAMETRPDFLAAKDRLAAAEAGRKAAGAQLLPSLRVDADYGSIGMEPADAHPTYTLSATVHVPIFEAGRAQARRAEADALLQRRKAELEDVRGQIDLEVRSALLDVRSAAQQLETARTARELADQELTQARDRFAAGVASNIEVTQAQESVASASERYIAALYAHNVAKASLARAVGIAESAVLQYLGGGGTQ